MVDQIARGSSDSAGTQGQWIVPATTEPLNDEQTTAFSHTAIGGRRFHQFLPTVSGVLLAGVFVGFAKTFFLRSQFKVPPIPPYLYVHGVMLTTWFVLVFAQTYLVAAHRTDLHRRLGIVAAVVAALLIPINTFVVVHAAERAHGVMTPLLRLEVVGDLLTVIVFAGFVATALYFRRRPEVHKRLMVASCFIFYGPVFARFELLYGLPVPPPTVIPLGLVVLGSYDLLVARRLHRATVWIGVVLLGLLVLLGVLIATGAADTIIRAL
jgi:hypothetical protein